jgi:hypothetical protein
MIAISAEPTPDTPAETVKQRFPPFGRRPARGTPDGETREMVFDPLVFDRPILVEQWANALHDTPTLLRTAPGEPPLPARGGTGYWPGPDPLEGPDVHARETLEEYRRLIA